MIDVIGKKYAFLFQGAGADYQKFLYMLDEDQKKILNHYCSIVNKEIKLDLWNYLYNSLPTKYNKTINDSVAMYTCDYVVYNAFINFNIKPEIFLCYSLGLVTSMACGKSISFETGLRIILGIYEYPEFIVRQGESMAVIIGMDCNDVDKIIEKNSLEHNVEIGSENSQNCVLVSGIKTSVIEVIKIAEAEGAMTVKELDIPYAYHSHFALIGIEKFERIIEKSEVVDSNIPIMSSYNQHILQDVSDLKKELVKNIYGRMYWKTSVEKVAKMGISNFVDVTLDGALTKMCKSINIDSKFLTYKKFVNNNLKLKLMDDVKWVEEINESKIISSL
ncbi:ACP S-malonyltransferase [Clostridium estertheticum]|uniref:ACP S-malonyltransferase n=1 Tax=Clostridium estertheticum TaxID=238834 RepID=UPI001C7D8CC4|nr:ACP S-malonyltransferase [Clostridium estertheticum]MBX4266828.1 ACP S-malonyltransferase [Clostridium estertheticum]WLC89014.1 ACP S-malonyltransferase [Clostridium estertheticum]